MDYTVASSPILALVGLVAVVGLLLVLIARFRWHVFLALLVPILMFGVLPGVKRNGFIEAFESGFGSTLGKIGVVIVLGSVLAVLLEKSGAIEVITRSLVRLLGSRRMPLALTLAGFVLGVAIFSDVAYVILNPLVHSSAATAGVGVARMATGLVGALQGTTRSPRPLARRSAGCRAVRPPRRSRRASSPRVPALEWWPGRVPGRPHRTSRTRAAPGAGGSGGMYGRSRSSDSSWISRGRAEDRIRAGCRERRVGS